MANNRRDFLKILGGTAGVAVLSSCKSSGEEAVTPLPPTPLPNGYSFKRLFSLGETLPGGGIAEYFPGSVKIQDNNQILFHAVDTTTASRDDAGMGLYDIEMDYSGPEPEVTGIYKVVRVGDEIGSGKVVTSVQLADHNATGSVAVRLHIEGDHSHSLYLERSRSGGISQDGLQRVLGFQTPTPDGDAQFSVGLGNFDLHQNDDMLVVAPWFNKKGSKLGGEGLFHLPAGEVNSNGSILMQSDDLVPNTGHIIKKFGQVHGHYASGEYAVQIHTAPPTIYGSAKSIYGTQSEAGSAIIKGTVGGGVAYSKLVSASPGIASSAMAKAVTVSSSGDINYGPRINSDGDIAIVTHIHESIMHLTVGDKAIIGTGDLTPTGMFVSAIGGPVMGPDGLVFFVVSSYGNEELLVTNGTEIATLLSNGTKLFGESGPALQTIVLGYAREQADSQGRLVFIGEFDDRTYSIMLGVPL